MGDRWPGDEPPPSEQPTRVTPPSPSAGRAAALREELTHRPAGSGVGELIALAILEVSAAIDRLRHDIRDQQRQTKE